MREVHIDWLVNAPYADALRAHPAIDGIVPFERTRANRSVAGFVSMLRRLRAARYDAVIDAQGLARSGLFALATGSPIRIARRDAREGASLVATHRVGGSSAGASCIHTVDAMLELLGPLGVAPIADMRLVTPPEDAAAAASDPVLGQHPIVLAPTSLWAGKRWPIERFAALAERLSEHAPVMVVGGPNERPQCEPLLRVPGVIDRVGCTTVGGLMAIIERARLVIANDSAALHMAVGFDRPCVALFGPTRTELVGPYGRDSDVIQHAATGDSFDHKNERTGRAMMERLSVDEVHRAALDRLTA